MLKSEVVLFDEEITCGLHELCTLCRVRTTHVVELVEEGVLTPEGPGQDQWSFDHQAIKRTQTALRLQRDLEVNLPGVALVLDLLDEVRELRQQIKRFE